MDAERILFVTDELFLPVHNGSARIYLDIAVEYRSKGYSCHVLSFSRTGHPDRLRLTASLYSKYFDSHCLLPFPAGTRDPQRLLAQAVREFERWISGNVFPQLWLKLPIARQAIKLASEYLEAVNPGIIYVHKLHALMLLPPILKTPPDEVVQVLDLHDDFIEKELQYHEANRNYIQAVSLIRAIQEKPLGILRHLVSHVNEERSRRVEQLLFERVGEVRISSLDEHCRYLNRATDRLRVVHCPWTVRPDPANQQDAIEASYDIGFIGSDDVMNVDALIALRDEVLPHLRLMLPNLTLLVAGKVCSPAAQVLRHIPGVLLLGSIERVSDFYRSVKIVVVPLRYGSGVSIKVLEALANGREVVSTVVGARGINRDSRLVVCPSWNAMAETIATKLR